MVKHSRRLIIENTVPLCPFERLAMPHSTFHYKPVDLHAFEPPDCNEILHVKDSKGHNYLTVEEIDGKLLVTVGLLKIIVAELANPILTTQRERNRYAFNPSLFPPIA